MAALIVEKECDVETAAIMKNKTIALIKKVEDCKPFVASSIFFVCLCFSNSDWNYDLFLL